MEISTVSIVTPSYNQGQFLAETIESVLCQEGEFQLDFIIVDGASTDNSVKIIRKYETLLDQGEWPVRCRGISYRWLSEPDQGQSDALIKGFALANGELLAWLNSDDTYLPGAVSKAIAALRQQPDIGLLHGRAHFTDANGEILGEVDTGPTDYNGLAALNLVCQPTAFFRKTAWDAVNGVDPELIYTMDHDLWIRMTRLFNAGYVDDFLATYRLHGGSKTVAAKDVVQFQTEILRTLRKHYNWAPANRVYGHCHAVINAMAPRFVVNHPLLFSTVTVLTAMIEYLRLNKCIRYADLKMLNRKNAHKVRTSLSQTGQGQAP
jgi:glycosyltransferase involved in cell wall biosynthesis